MSFRCPVCGFPGLQETPRSSTGGGSYEICPSCGFQFGVTDDDAGFTYTKWRENWKKQGCHWSSHGITPPPHWDPKAQLASLRVNRSKK